MLSNATNQPKSNVELGYMCPRGLLGHNINVQCFFVWPRITDEDSVPEIHIWSIFLNKSD